MAKVLLKIRESNCNYIIWFVVFKFCYLKFYPKKSKRPRSRYTIVCAKKKYVQFKATKRNFDKHIVKVWFGSRTRLKREVVEKKIWAIAKFFAFPRKFSWKALHTRCTGERGRMATNLSSLSNIQRDCARYLRVGFPAVYQ